MTHIRFNKSLGFKLIARFKALFKFYYPIIFCTCNASYYRTCSSKNIYYINIAQKLSEIIFPSYPAFPNSLRNYI